VHCVTPRFAVSFRADMQSICYDKFPSVARTAIPGVVDYPISNAAKSWRFVSGLMYLAYGLTFQECARGLWLVMSNLGPKRYRKP
jgi:hypothetical protein